LELRFETPNGKKYAFGGTSQRLIIEIRSSAADAEDKASASADSDLQQFTLGIEFLMRIPSN
jgi:hypothetical protein